MNTLFCLRDPPTDPTTGKALRLPIVNPISRHGRVFFFAWLSFLLSFLSWYSTVALLPDTIKNDIQLTTNETKNAAIIGGVASLLVRLIAGEMCDHFGPRYVLVGLLWVSAIPCGAAGTASDALGFYFVKFFMGIAGAVFVACQCLMAQWFDKRVIGTASAFASGWGDSGVGVTFFVMPAIFNSLTSLHGISIRIAWRVSFLVPCVLLLAVGLAVLLLTDDTPLGPWSEREKNQPRRESAAPVLNSTANSSMTVFDRLERPSQAVVKGDLEKNDEMTAAVSRRESEASETVAPAPKQSFGSQLKDLACLPTLMLCATYFATFGASLSVNNSLLTWYMAKFSWSQTYAANWASLFGLLNLFSRPIGGIIADILYRRFGEAEGRGLVAKKYWMSVLAVVGGVLGLLVGLISPDTPVGLVVLVSVFAVFIEAGNGATYALLPAVNPHINGLMGGVVGASGNLGGVVYSSVARYRSIRTTIASAGVTCIIVGLVIPFINHVPRNKRTLYKSSTAATAFNPSFP